MRKQASGGFTLIELVVVVAVIAIIASIAIPKMQYARLTANESSAVGVLRTLFTAQNQLQTSASIDTDADGAGEFGYFAELAGTVPARVSIGGAPGAGLPGADELEPSPLVTSLGSVSQSVVAHSGYVFQIWLPAATAGGATAAEAEDLTGGKLAAPFPDSNNGEIMWCAYAWPLVANATGNSCFFVNEQGLILRARNNGAAPYSGIAGGPAFDAAYRQAGDMGSRLSGNGAPGVDGNLWMPVN